MNQDGAVQEQDGQFDRSGPLRLSCVVPAYNEAGHLERFLKALSEVAGSLTSDFEIIVVNDGSRDETGTIARRLVPELPLRYLEFSRNFGKEAALTAGIDHASGDLVVLIDADFQHPLELVPEMVRLWRSGYDMIYGVIANRHAEGALKRMGTRCFYGLVHWDSSVDIPRNGGDFRLMDRRVVDALRQLSERNRFMKGLYAWVGFRTVALPFVPEERRSGVSSFNLRRLVNLGLQGVTSFTTMPLRVWGVIGMVISFLALLYGLWVLIDTLLFGNSENGWPTLVVSLMFFSGVQLISIGVMGEYIGRIYQEVKQRPLYLVARDERHGAGEQRSE